MITSKKQFTSEERYDTVLSFPKKSMFQSFESQEKREVNTNSVETLMKLSCICTESLSSGWSDE